MYPRDRDTVQIGRVLTVKRGIGLGRMILQAGIAQSRDRYHPRRICVEAQCYASGYYAREGFRTCSDVFMEDGIPHVEMELLLPACGNSREERNDIKP